MKSKILIPLLLIILVGCSPMPSNETERESNGNFDIITIDSCEYIEFDNGWADCRVYSLTHKGNCKFCIERSKRK